MLDAFVGYLSFGEVVAGVFALFLVVEILLEVFGGPGVDPRKLIRIDLISFWF